VQPSDFDYDLPPESIAQEPSARRDHARLLVHDVARDITGHERVTDLPDLLREGDLLVINDTRVIPTRLFGHRRSGGRVELLLVEPTGEGGWRALVNPARKLKPGERLPLEGGVLEARMVSRPLDEEGNPGMEWIVELVGVSDEEQVLALLERHGHVPLPPYIDRSEGEGDQGGARGERDRERYQTIYASHPGAVAAPTAGLHFTEELFQRLEEKGVRRAALTLHVGPGTFRPVKAERLEEHRMHSERFVLPPEVVEAVEETRERGGRVVAVGTTSVRVLESQVGEDGRLLAGAGATDLFLRPGSRFQVVDALLTNFHLPRSSLIMLVSAFAGRERILRLYAEAVERAYRFYSFGDAMLLFGRERERSVS
jgi:S-adenosylmethionine:tRNA ribosyltransferase-isomerase